MARVRAACISCGTGTSVDADDPAGELGGAFVRVMPDGTAEWRCPGCFPELWVFSRGGPAENETA